MLMLAHLLILSPSTAWNTASRRHTYTLSPKGRREVCILIGRCVPNREERWKLKSLSRNNFLNFLLTESSKMEEKVKWILSWLFYPDWAIDPSRWGQWSSTRHMGPPQHSGAIQKPEEDKHNSRNTLMIHILYRIRSGWCVRGCCTTPDSNQIRKHNRITSRDRNRGQACLPILTRDNN
jgi:hypothetical protein